MKNQIDKEEAQIDKKFGPALLGKRAKDTTLKTMKDKLDDMLLKNYEESNDHLSLSHQLETEVKVGYNLPSLMKSEFLNDVDPELIDSDISDQQFLVQQRIRAETKLIKASILYKQHNGIYLSEKE